MVGPVHMAAAWREASSLAASPTARSFPSWALAPIWLTGPHLVWGSQARNFLQSCVISDTKRPGAFALVHGSAYSSAMRYQNNAPTTWYDRSRAESRNG